MTKRKNINRNTNPDTYYFHKKTEKKKKTFFSLFHTMRMPLAAQVAATACRTAGEAVLASTLESSLAKLLATTVVVVADDVDDDDDGGAAAASTAAVATAVAAVAVPRRARRMASRLSTVRTTKSIKVSATVWKKRKEKILMQTRFEKKGT